MPSRRTVLGAAGVLLSAGCLESTGGPGTGQPSRTDEPPDESTSPETPTLDEHTGGPRSPAGCDSGFDVSARRVDVVEWLPLRLSEDTRPLVATAAETGSATVNLYGDVPPVPDGAFVEHEGTFSEATTALVATEELPAVVFDVEWERGQAAPADGTVFAFADLPANDRAAVEYAIYGAPFGREMDRHPSEGLSRRESPIPYPDGTAGSELTAVETAWVRWNDRTYRIRTGGETTKTRYRFRIELSAVADDPADFRELVADRHLLALSDLTDDERAVLETAAGGTYEACEDDPGVVALRERLSGDEVLPQPRHHRWYVSFDGERYALRIYHWVH